MCDRQEKNYKHGRTVPRRHQNQDQDHYQQKLCHSDDDYSQDTRAKADGSVLNEDHGRPCDKTHKPSHHHKPNLHRASLPEISMTSSTGSSSSSPSSFSSSSSSGSSFSSSSSSSSSSFSSDTSSDCWDRAAHKKPRHSQSCTDITGKRGYFDGDDDTAPLIDKKRVSRRSVKGKREKGKCSRGPTQDTANKTQKIRRGSRSDGNVRKSKSMEALSRPKDGEEHENCDENEQETRKGEARKNLMKEKMKFSAFLNEITRQVLSPMRLTTLGVTDAQRPCSPRQASVKSRNKHGQQKSRPTSADSVSSSERSHTSKQHCTQLSKSKSFHHSPSHHSGDSPSHMYPRPKSCTDISCSKRAQTPQHHNHTPSNKGYHRHQGDHASRHHHRRHHCEDCNCLNNQNPHRDQDGTDHPHRHGHHGEHHSPTNHHGNQYKHKRGYHSPSRHHHNGDRRYGCNSSPTRHHGQHCHRHGNRRGPSRHHHHSDQHGHALHHGEEQSTTFHYPHGDQSSPHLHGSGYHHHQSSHSKTECPPTSHHHRHHSSSSDHGNHHNPPHHHHHINQHHLRDHHSEGHHHGDRVSHQHRHGDHHNECTQHHHGNHQSPSHHHRDHHNEITQHHHGNHQSPSLHHGDHHNEFTQHHHEDHYSPGHHHQHGDHHRETYKHHHGDHYRETHEHHHGDHHRETHEHHHGEHHRETNERFHGDQHRETHEHHHGDHHRETHEHHHGDHCSFGLPHHHGDHHKESHWHFHEVEHNRAHLHHHDNHHSDSHSHHHSDHSKESHPQLHDNHRSDSQHHSDHFKESHPHLHGDHHNESYPHHHGNHNNKSHPHHHGNHPSESHPHHHGNHPSESHPHHHGDDIWHHQAHHPESHVDQSHSDSRHHDDLHTHLKGPSAHSPPLHRKSDSHTNKADLPSNPRSHDEEQTSFLDSSSSYKIKPEELGRNTKSQDKDEGPRQSSLKTAVRTQCSGEEFMSNQKLLEAELQKTRGELGDLTERFKRLHDSCSSTEQTNDLLQKNLHAVAQSMEGERERLNRRISALTEQLADAKCTDNVETETHFNATSALHNTNIHFQSGGAINQVVLPVTPPPTQFMDGHDYGKAKASGQEQPLGSVPEEEEDSDWSEMGEEIPRFILTGLGRNQVWRHQEGDMDGDSESGGEETFRLHSARTPQIPHLQFTIHSEILPALQTNTCPPGFTNLSEAMTVESSYRITSSPALCSSILIRSASLEELPHRHVLKELRGTEAMTDLHHPGHGVIEDLDDEIIHHWRTSSDMGAGIGSAMEGGLVGLQSAEQMLNHFICESQRSEGKVQSRAEVHGWTGGIRDEVLEGERTEL